MIESEDLSMQINSISSVNNNSSNQPNFKGLGTRPIKIVRELGEEVIFPNLNLRIIREGDYTVGINTKTGKVTSRTFKGYHLGNPNMPYRAEIDPHNDHYAYKRYFSIFTNPKTERGLFYDSKKNLMGDLYLENGNSYRFEPKKTTLVERIKAARQEKSVKGFINRLLGKKAQIICTKYNSEVKPIGQTELPPLSIEDVLRMDASGELSKLCK